MNMILSLDRNTWRNAAICVAIVLAIGPTRIAFEPCARAQTAAPEKWEAAAAERTGPAAVLAGPGATGGGTQAATSLRPAAEPTQPAAATAEPKPTRALGGYSFSDRKAAPRAAGRAPRSAVRVARGPQASFPAFLQRADGSAQLTVELSQGVEVTEQRAAGRTIYVLRGAHVPRANDLRPLVASHFNSPLVRAELRNAGTNVELVTELRGVAAPSMHVAARPGGATLVIDIPASGVAASGPSATAPTPATPATPPAR